VSLDVAISLGIPHVPSRVAVDPVFAGDLLNAVGRSANFSNLIWQKLSASRAVPALKDRVPTVVLSSAIRQMSRVATPANASTRTNVAAFDRPITSREVKSHPVTLNGGDCASTNQASSSWAGLEVSVTILGDVGGPQPTFIRAASSDFVPESLAEVHDSKYTVGNDTFLWAVAPQRRVFK
jgi:hypothetical protein